MITWFDYFLLVAMLTISTLIGIYFGCFGSKQRTTNEYLMGDKRMKILPNAVSMTVSQFSAVMIIGVPSDTYKYGAGMCLCFFSYLLAVIINNFVMLPVIFSLGLTTIYEYLEIRFDKKVKLFVVFLFVLQMTLYLPLVIQASSIAAASVTGINITWIYLGVSAIYILYTTLGGLKGVVWTDFFQYTVVLVCFFTTLGLSIKSNDFRTMWKVNLETDRLKIFDFDFTLTDRNGIWTMIIGYTFQVLAQMSIFQNESQKMLSLSTLNAAKLCAYVYAFNLYLVITFSVFIGLEIFGRYFSCDPLSNHQIKRNDELVLYYLSDIGAGIPGLTGLFLASLFSASLSTLSCTLNALGGVIYRDFVCTYFRKSDGSEKSTTVKFIVLVNGILVTMLVFLYDKLKGSIHPTVFTLMAITSGPCLGVFLLGMLFPRANKKGGLFGPAIGFCFLASLAISSKYFQTIGGFKYPEKPIFLDGCNSTNVTLDSWLFNYKNHTLVKNIVKIRNAASQHEIPSIFRISFYYFTLLGALVTIVSGLIISYLTKEEVVERKLISPICRFLLPKENTRERIQYSTVLQQHE